MSRRIEYKALIYRVIGLSIICFVHMPLIGQVYPAKFYSTLDGLPSHSIYDIRQARDRTMWFITAKGLVNYDGQKWRKEEASFEFPNSEFSRLVISRGNSIWVVGQNNEDFLIAYKNENKWSRLASPPIEGKTLTSFAFHHQTNTEDTTLWLAIGNQLLRYTKGAWTELDFDKKIYAFHKSLRGVWVGTEDGIYEIIGNTLTRRAYEVPRNEVLAFREHGEHLYVLGKSWIADIIGDSLEQVWTNIQLEEVSRFGKHHLITDGDGHLFYNGDTPAMTFDTRTGQSKILQTDGRIRNAKCVAIFQDIEQNIWIGDHRGLVKLNLFRFSNYDQRSGLLEPEVSAIKELKDGYILLANPKAISIVKNEVVTNSLPLPCSDYLDCRVLDIEESSDGRVLLAYGQGGLLSWSGGAFTELTKTNFGRTLNITSIEKWRDKLFVISWKEGTFELRGTELLPLHDFGESRNLVAVSDTLSVLTTGSGSFLIKPNDTVPITHPQRNLRNSFSATIWEDNLLVATAGGLAVYDTALTIFEPVNIDVASYGILKASNGDLWVGSGDGIFRWSDNRLFQYNSSNGLSGNEVNRNALVEDSYGRIWIGTESGASMYQLEKEVDRNYIPQLSILELQDKTNKQYDPKKEVLIPYEQNNIAIAFRGISFVEESKINYEYRLSNVDNKWLTSNNSNTTVRYTNLRSGTYTFQVRARSGQGPWSNTKEISFTIERPFYQTGWFLVLMILAFGGLVFMLQQVKYFYLMNRQKRLKELVQERTEEILRLNQTLEEAVKQRTSQLENRNSQLEEYAFINAHLLRGPLSRIQSLVHVIEMSNENQLDPELMSILKTSLIELDNVIYSINEILSDEGRPVLPEIRGISDEH